MSKYSKTFKNLEYKKWILIFLSLIIMLIISLICTTLGITESSVVDVLKTIIKAILNDVDLSTSEKVILNLRLSRTVLALTAGAGLSLSGILMQSVTRNPLVSPFTLGISSAAGFGAAIAILSGFTIFNSNNIAIVVFAFLMSLLCALLTFALSSKNSISSISLILVGTALNYLFQALSTTVQFIAEDTKLASIVNWIFGSLNGAKWSHVKIITIIVLICLVSSQMLNKNFTMLSVMDDELAKTSGTNPKKTRIYGLLISTFMTASIISFTGVIGFVGLAAPHIARSIIGSNNKYLIPFGSIVGALLLLISDTIGRLILSPIIMPVGIVISFIGVPIFLHQVALNRRTYR